MGVWSCVELCGAVWSCVELCGAVWSCVELCGASSMVARSIAGRITQALLSNDERAEARSSDWLTLGWREIFESLRGENCPHPGNRTERKEAGPSCTILDPQCWGGSVPDLQIGPFVSLAATLPPQHLRFGRIRSWAMVFFAMTDIQTMNSLRDVRWCTIHIYSEFIWNLGELDIIVSVSPFDFLWHVNKEISLPCIFPCWCPTWPGWGQFPMPEKSMMKKSSNGWSEHTLW